MLKEKQLVPKLRFSEFEEIWTKLPFERIVKFVKSGKSKKDENGAYNLYGSTGIIGRTNDNIDEGEYLLVARVGANAGQINLTKGIFGVSDNTLIVSFKNDIKIEFVKEFLIQFDLNRLVFGSGQPLVTGGLLKKIKIVMPQSQEQQKIANFLTSIDTQIQILEKKKSLLEQYKKGIMQKIFKEELKFKDKYGNEFPDWKESKISSVLLERNIKTPKSKSYPLMAFVANKGVVHKGERYNREFLVSKGSVKKYKQTEYGDFIYSSNNLESGSIGLNLYGSACISPVYSIFQIKESSDYRFIDSYLKRKSFINKMVRFRQGVVYGQWKIHESAFLKIEEKFPCLKEQIKIANFLSALDKNIAIVNSKIEQTKAYKKGLLQQMFV